MSIKGIKGIKIAKGQSILEIIVALAVFSMIGASLASLILGSFSTLSRSGEIIQAAGLADEGIEAIRSIARKGWQELTLNSVVIDASSGSWAASAGTGELISDKYFRTISLSPVFRNASLDIVSATTSGANLDAGSKKIAVRVEWPLDNGSTGWVERYAYVTDWNYDAWLQSDWSGGSGQEVWENTAQYLSDGGNMDISVPNRIALAQVATSTYPASSFIISSAFDTGTSSIFKDLMWQEELPVECGASCSIKFQIKTAAIQGGLDSAPWLGPLSTGATDDFFASSTGTRIPAIHNGDRWIMYKAELNGDTSHTPALLSSSLSFKNQN